MSSKQLWKALSQQCSWGAVLTAPTSACSSADRVRAYFYAAMHISFVLILLTTSMWPRVSVIVICLLYIIAFFISLLVCASFEEYADQMNNALELEKTQNSLVVAVLSVRIFTLLHAFMVCSKLMIFFGLIDIVYTIYQHRAGHSLLVDATTVWKEVERVRLDRRIRLVYNGVLVLVSFLAMLLHFYDMRSPRTW